MFFSIPDICSPSQNSPSGIHMIPSKSPSSESWSPTTCNFIFPVIYHIQSLQLPEKQVDFAVHHLRWTYSIWESWSTIIINIYMVLLLCQTLFICKVYYPHTLWRSYNYYAVLIDEEFAVSRSSSSMTSFRSPAS